MFSRRLVLVFGAVLVGCSGDDEVPPCEFTEDVVELDAEIDTGFAGFPIIPSKIIEVITQPLTGELEYRGATSSEWVSVMPASGSTTFTSVLTHEGPVVWSRVPDATGQHLSKCRPTLRFDVSLAFQTEDGVFDEVWSGVAEIDGSAGSLVTVEVDSDPETKFALQWNADADPLESQSYSHMLTYGTCVEDCGESPAMSGEIRFLGQFPATRDGEIIDQMGINVTLAKWTGFAAG